MLNPFSFSNVSIRKRLPLLIFFLLLSVIIAFGYTSYLAIKNAELSAGKERLRTVTAQTSASLQQRGAALITSDHETANQPSIKKYLASRGKDSSVTARQALDKMKID